MIPKGYFAILEKEPESGHITIDFPEHENICSSGLDWKHAEEMAHEALNVTLEEEFKVGFKLPKASKPKAKKGQKVIFVPLRLDLQIAFLLRESREAAGLTQAEMARRLGIKQQSYQRYERPGQSNISLKTLDNIAKALGNSLSVTFSEREDRAYM